MFALSHSATDYKCPFLSPCPSAGETLLHRERMGSEAEFSLWDKKREEERRREESREEERRKEEKKEEEKRDKESEPYESSRSCCRIC